MGAVTVDPDREGWTPLEGRIIDLDGSPAAGARVWVNPGYRALPCGGLGTEPMDPDGSIFVQMVGDDGRFACRVTPERGPMSVPIVAFGDGSVSAVHQAHVDRDAVDAGDIQLHPAIPVMVVVLDETGTLVEGATVALTTHTQQEDTTYCWMQATTGADGVARVASVPAGVGATLSVYVSHPEHAPVEGVEVDPVESADDAHVEIVLPAGRRVCGRLIDESGAPAAGFGVVPRPLRLGSMTQREIQTIDDDGRFTLLGVACEEHVLDVFLPRARSSDPPRHRVAIPAEGDVELGDIVLPPPRVLHGRVLARDGTPLHENRDEMLRLTPVFSFGTRFGGRLDSVRLRNDGTFRIEDLADIPWFVLVDVTEPDGVHYRHEFDDLRATDEPLELHATGDRSIFLRLHPKGSPDEPLALHEYFLGGKSLGIGHVGPPDRSGGLCHFDAITHPGTVLEGAYVNAPGYHHVQLGDIDLTNGLVILDVELEPETGSAE